jgi:hypothetical protein
MPPYTPNLASRLRPGRAIAFALTLGVALVGDAALRVSSPPKRPIVCDVVIATPVVPDANAANLVGIYRSSTCMLTLDASGTYVSDCGGRHADRYAISGEDVVLGGAQHLAISGSGRLVAADGTIFSITGGTR